MLKRNLWHPAEFQYPASWLVDQRLFRRAAEQAERQRPLDPPPLGCAPQTRPCILVRRFATLCNSSSAALIAIPTHACIRRQGSVVSLEDPANVIFPTGSSSSPRPSGGWLSPRSRTGQPAARARRTSASSRRPSTPISGAALDHIEAKIQRRNTADPAWRRIFWCC